MLTGAFRWLYLRLTEKLYTEWAGIYDLVSAIVSLGQWHQWRLDALQFTHGESILELGPGTGHLLAAMADSGHKGVGAEASPQMAVRASRRIRDRGARPAVVQTVAQALPFENECFDSVVSTFPAGYILDSDTLQEVTRVLCTSSHAYVPGRLVVAGLWTDTSHGIWRWLFAPFYGHPHIRAMQALTSSLQEAGLSPAIFELLSGNFRIGYIVAIKLASAHGDRVSLHIEPQGKGRARA
jgi:ubiquinone/menaquinone biosynthesis C-methylase UbiE